MILQCYTCTVFYCRYRHISRVSRVPSLCCSNRRKQRKSKWCEQEFLHGVVAVLSYLRMFFVQNRTKYLRHASVELLHVRNLFAWCIGAKYNDEYENRKNKYASLLYVLATQRGST